MTPQEELTLRRELVRAQDHAERAIEAAEKLLGRLMLTERIAAEATAWAKEAARLAKETGRVPFGTHTASPSLLEMDGQDSAGMPLWERLHVEHEVQLNAWVCDSPYVSSPEALLRAFHERFEVRVRPVVDHD